MKSVTMQWANENSKDINLIDIRTIEEYNERNIPNTTHIVMDELIANHSKYLNKNDTYYLMCRSGRRSANTINQLSKEGYKLINVDGGIISI